MENEGDDICEKLWGCVVKEMEKEKLLEEVF